MFNFFDDMHFISFKSSQETGHSKPQGILKGRFIFNFFYIFTYMIVLQVLAIQHHSGMTATFTLQTNNVISVTQCIAT